MNKNMIKPYGDTLNDGFVQLSFTLPVEHSSKAVKAANLYVSKLNFTNISVVHSKKIADNFTYFVVYAQAKPTIDYSLVKEEKEHNEALGFYEINRQIKAKLKKKIVVVGASIGSDAHTVGIDAIMNMKGYKHDYGLERYQEIKTVNMGAQVSCEALVEKADSVHADVILISQTVTQKESHVKNLTYLIKLLKKNKIKDRYILIAGGPRITNGFAVGLGYNAGFGLNTMPSQVATFILNSMLKKK